MISRRKLSSLTLHIDWPLFFCILILTSFGLLILFSAKQEFEVINRQFLRFCLAFAFMFGIAQIPPRVFRAVAPWLYFVGLTLLAFVLILGDITKGGQRWLDFWIIRFQPAELMKIAVPMMLAKYLDDHLLPPSFRTLLIPLVLILLPVLLVAKQPDLGTALLILSTGCFVLFFSGLSWKWIFSFSLTFAASLPILWYCLYDYQRQRVMTFLNPERDPLGSGYQIIQSKIAIGSGGLYGKGWLNGTQTHLEFLPERTTDVIFAVFGEEFGLVGCIILLLVYLCIMIRGLYIGVEAQDTFCRLLSGSLIMTVFVYVFVNIGMVTGILPAVGIPLPLISYGGTSLVTLMASFGILMSIRTHRTLLAK
jgi:rod shape determining protein RodA